MDHPERRPLTQLRAAVFMSSFDRLSVAPLLLPMANDLDVPLTAVTAMVTAYLVAYGLMQVVWGIVSDRLGRLRTVSLALALAGAASVATALAPGLTTLVLARLLAGGAFAAIVPGALIWVGDRIPVRERHGPLTDIMAATALGMAAATLVSGTMAQYLDWRSVFLLTALPVLAMAWVLFRSPDHRPERSVGTRFWQPLRHALSHGWTRVVLALAFVEGVLFLGVLMFLPTVLQQGGMPTSTSGLVTASYGVAVICFAAVVKRVSGRLGLTRLITIGALMGIGSYVAMTIDDGAVGVLVGSTLLAGAWAFMHSSMQHWATQVLPEARASVISLFASCLFLGSSAGAAVGGVFAGAQDFHTGFLWGIAGTGLLAVAAVVARRRYPEH